MIKSKAVLLLAALAVFLTTGMTAQAVPANCPTCAMNDIVTPLKTYGEHVGHYTQQHMAEYSENLKYYKVNCTITGTVDKVSWVCNNGHGTVLTQYHHVEWHTCSHCEGLDYYADN